MNQRIIASAIETISIEAKSVSDLCNFINDDFVECVKDIHQSKGRVICSGIGKSAIVAQKMVATFNSTGTAALFMHAADAIHGDLGMIQQDDIVIVISKSGESPEIKALVPLIKSFNNILIALVGNVNSYLAKEAKYVINTTVEKEACKNNLAPTSSSTAQLVMGDALAVALMDLNDFTEKHFAKFHPGGNLGKRLYLTVADLVVNGERPTVSELDNVREVIVEITKKRLGVTAVVNDDNVVVGIITDGDLRRMLERRDDINILQAKDIASYSFKFIQESILAVQALEEFRKHDISQLLVFREKEYIGVLHLHDLVREGIM